MAAPRGAGRLDIDKSVPVANRFFSRVRIFFFAEGLCGFPGGIILA